MVARIPMKMITTLYENDRLPMKMIHTLYENERLSIIFTGGTKVPKMFSCSAAHVLRFLVFFFRVVHPGKFQSLGNKFFMVGN